MCVGAIWKAVCRQMGSNPFSILSRFGRWHWSCSCNVYTYNFNFFFAASKAETSSFLDGKLGHLSHEQRLSVLYWCHRSCMASRKHRSSLPRSTNVIRLCPRDGHARAQHPAETACEPRDGHALEPHYPHLCMRMHLCLETWMLARLDSVDETKENSTTGYKMDYTSIMIPYNQISTGFRLHHTTSKSTRLSV
jgi:hypothetical protein